MSLLRKQICFFSKSVPFIKCSLFTDQKYKMRAKEAPVSSCRPALSGPLPAAASTGQAAAVPRRPRRRGAVGPGPALAPTRVSPDYKQPSSEAAGRDTSPAAPGKCRLAGKLVQMAQNPRTAFHRRKRIPKHGGETRAGTGKLQETKPCSLLIRSWRRVL